MKLCCTRNFLICSVLAAICWACALLPENSQQTALQIQRYAAEHLFAGDRGDQNDTDSYLATGSRAMVVSESAIASEIGLAVLRQGGNAVDAAIAVSFALAVLRPHATGIGGGGFALLYLRSSHSFVFLDMRERAPARAHPQMYLRMGQIVPELSQQGALAVAVPGLVAGLKELHVQYGSGRISWSELIEPSVRWARSGFQVYPHLAEAISWFATHRKLGDFPKLKKLVTHGSGHPNDPNETLLGLGDRFSNRALAETLERLAHRGGEEFYQGRLGAEIVSAIKSQGGIIEREDLRDYAVRVRPPIMSHYRGYGLVSAPPPSSGGVLLAQMLHMFEHFELKSLGLFNPLAIHLKAEVMKRAFADRARYLGDPEYGQLPIAGLLSKQYAAERIKNIRLQPGLGLVPEISTDTSSGEPHKYESPSTTHFSIVDSQGNAVASTQSINYFFGSGVVAGNTGIILNNTMDDFSHEAGVANTFGLVGSRANIVEAGKTPLSSMSPTMLTQNGNLFLVLGSPGGPRIISAVLNVILNVVDQKLTLQNAVFAPRVHHQWRPNTVIMDSFGFAPDTKEKLRQRGHTVEESAYGIGSISAIMTSSKGLIGVSDPRREGGARGY